MEKITNMRLAAGVGFLLAGALFTSSAANAAASIIGDPAAGLQSMRELNLIVLGNMKGGHTVEGKTFVGGNLTNGSTFGTGNSQQGATAGSRATLVVGGNVSGNNLMIQNGANGSSGKVGDPASVIIAGNLSGQGLSLNTQNVMVRVGGDIQNVNGSNGSTIKVGGKSSGYMNHNGSAVTLNMGSDYASDLRAGLSAEQASLSADLKQLSQDLTKMQQTVGNKVTSNGGRLSFHAADDGSGISVFTMGASMFNFSEFDMSLANQSTTVIINISGANTYNWNANSIGGLNGGLNDNIIWNFSDATTLNVNRKVHGSVLAPNALLNNFSEMYGTVVAAEMNQKAKVGLGSYQGRTDFLPTDVVPEPGSWAMMIVGFGLVGAYMRFNKRQRKSVTN